MQLENVTSLLVETARNALPNLGRVTVAYPETDITIPTVMVRCTMATQHEVGIGERWSTGSKANMYDVTAHFDIYGDDTLDVDSLTDDLTDYISKNRAGMQSWTSDVHSGEGASMIDITLVGLGDMGYVEELDAWRKVVTYIVTVVKPQT